MRDTATDPAPEGHGPRGLSSAEAARRLALHGPNTLGAATTTPAWRILARQFTGLLVLLLIGAAAVASVLGEWIDAAAIGMVVVLNGALGFVQEWRAETALVALRNMLSPKARVIRDGRPREIDAKTLVPGDLVLLDAGDRVPADLRLTAATDLRVDESVMTGESLPVPKATEDGERARALMGTSVVAGRGEGVVAATGAQTEFGRIAELAGSVGEVRTHLTLQLARLARQLGAAALLLGAAIAVLGVLAGRGPVEMAMTGLSLAVAIVPEGLPAVVTISLALGAAAMVRQKALARRLQAMETLGAASVICTDKTGTLTENMMTATTLWLAGRTLDVTGTGYDPAGRIERDGAPLRHGAAPALDALLDVAAGCTHAALVREDGDWRMVGDPTEGALVTLAHKGRAPGPAGAPLSEIPFSSERKRMSVVVRAQEGGLVQLAKGAPEAILDVCDRWHGPDGPAPLDASARAGIDDAYRAMAAEGQRVIALASRPVERPGAAEEGMVFLGLTGLIDPPRPEVRAAIAACHAAGIRVLMITGDSPLTARAIAEALDLPAERAITGPELDGMDRAALRAALAGDVLFARTRPEHKMRLVEALQADGRIVAMTGDGVNDAPALKRADIGVAMGTRGTDVAKDAADLVLLDDNFATLERAIREGRRQFANIRRFVRYLLSSNAGEVVAIVAGIVVGGPLIYLPTQILWMNLVTDGVTAVALALEKATPDQMTEPPRPLSAGILDWKAVALIAAFGAYTGTASLWLFYATLPEGETVARTAAFTGMVLFEKASVFAFRAFSRPNWRIGWLSNRALVLALLAMLGAQMAAVYWPPLQALLRTAPLDWGHWQAIGALCLPLLLVPEAIKTVAYLRARRAAADPAPA